MNEYRIEFQNGLKFESDEGCCDNISLDLEYQIHPEDNDETRENNEN